MKLVGELIEVISERAGLKNIREVGELLKTGRRRSADDKPTGAPLDKRTAGLADVVGSDLLEFGQMLIAGMKSTTGEGPPDIGVAFGRGHSEFLKAESTLQSAAPDDRWDGSGSRAYADQNTRQQLRTETMADADRAVHRVLFREAAQITLRRNGLDDQSNLLAYTSYATFALQFIPRYGEAAKFAVELAALQGALAASADLLYQLHSEVSANATELQQAVGRYSSVTGGTELPSAGGDFGPPSQPPGGTPTIAVPAGPPSSSGGIATPSGVPLSPGGAGTMPGVDVPPVPPGIADAGPTPVLDPLPVPPAPTTPPTPPSVAPAAAAGPLGALISPLAGLLTSAALSAAQRAASSGQPGHPEDRNSADEADRSDGDDEPTKEHDKKSKQTEHASAAGGGTERAPVDEIDSDRHQPQTPMAIRLDPDTSPGLPAGMSPQDTK